MPKRHLALILIISLFLSSILFSENAESEAGDVLSLKQIDLLIDTTAYNDALKELSRYIAAHPNDFDRAQKRISRVMKLREEYNNGAGALVDLIRSGDESKAEKLSKIAELENSELDSNENVIEFTNLARRTVTLGEVLILYDKIMREGVALVRKEKFSEAAVKFEEGFAIKNEVSDIVFDTGKPVLGAEGIPVVYESDITEPVRRSVGNVRSLVAGNLVSASMDARINECEKAFNEYIKAITARDVTAVSSALKNVNTAFEKYAALRNKIIAEVNVLERADSLANERNPLLGGTSYITFHKKFILGDESNPDTGIIGAFDAYFNSRVERMKEKTNEAVLESLNTLLKNLPEGKIYSLANKIDAEQKNVSVAKMYSQFARYVHDLYNLEKNTDGTTVGELHLGYASSMGFVSEYLSDLSLAYKSAQELAHEKANPEKNRQNRFL
jgi:hypothetical protein